MVDFDVTAKYYGDSVKFTVDAVDIKSALAVARVEAETIFDYQAETDREKPSVSVKLAKQKKEEGE